MIISSTRADATAISLSSLCLLHCLALPFLASALPLLGPAAEAEWVHRLLVILALPVSLFALARTRPGRDRWLFGAMLLAGAGLLLSGAFVEALHDWETPLTVLGALTLMTAHFFRWQRHRSADSAAFPPSDHL